MTKSGVPVLRPLDLQDEAHKTNSFEKIVREAKESEALAVITIFIARSEEFGDLEFDEQSYFWGKLEQAGAARSILMTVSGPAIKNWVVSVPFREENQQIEFSSQQEISGGMVLNLLPGWATEDVNPS